MISLYDNLWEMMAGGGMLGMVSSHTGGMGTYPGASGPVSGNSYYVSKDGDFTTYNQSWFKFTPCDGYVTQNGKFYGKLPSCKSLYEDEMNFKYGHGRYPR
jgi:hypothetical protein